MVCLKVLIFWRSKLSHPFFPYLAYVCGPITKKLSLWFETFGEINVMWLVVVLATKTMITRTNYTAFFFPILTTPFETKFKSFKTISSFLLIVKEVFSDSSIILWQESKDINKKKLLPKFQLIPVLRLKVMHDYVHWHCSIDYCVRLVVIDEDLSGNCFYVTLKRFQLNSFGKMCFLEKSYKQIQKIQILTFLRASSIWNPGACLRFYVLKRTGK